MMKKVFTHENRLIVENAKNIMALEGIRAEIKNEYSASASGDLSPIDSWPELWVENEKAENAIRLIKPLSEDSRGKKWTCQECKEQNEASFEWCWQCQHPKPE